MTVPPSYSKRENRQFSRSSGCATPDTSFPHPTPFQFPTPFLFVHSSVSTECHRTQNEQNLPSSLARETGLDTPSCPLTPLRDPAPISHDQASISGQAGQVIRPLALPNLKYWSCHAPNQGTERAKSEK
ncbi:hypothetical protein CEXT_663821 [Caerostris extrusa]|uniref:Uncharacterized protein n=1 Tax=Caerostris extrusa TaxID=172846 RepID=A0AAV4M694_CAEEX|nr:hypothetical protein CEXT_663821 [Caerostris extrusa]